MAEILYKQSKFLNQKKNPLLIRTYGALRPLREQRHPRTDQHDGPDLVGLRRSFARHL